jgi:tRNA pseudouridine38-40 synthase
LRTVKLVIAFQGTRFDGWQSQRTGKTLQELFEKNLSRILKEKVDVVSSSRTDSGVHARALVAHLRTRRALPASKIKAALNFYLPPDVLVRTAAEAASSFHARYRAKSKTYEYRVWNSSTRPAYDLAPHCLWFAARLDLARMRRAARVLVGRHDFSAFRDGGADERNPVRRVHSLVIRKQGPRVSLRIRADGFLRHMVRVIAGTLLDVGRGKRTPASVHAALRSKDRRLAGPTAKAHGLTLLKVHYA